MLPSGRTANTGSVPLGRPQDHPAQNQHQGVMGWWVQRRQAKAGQEADKGLQIGFSTLATGRPGLRRDFRPLIPFQTRAAETDLASVRVDHRLVHQKCCRNREAIHNLRERAVSTAFAGCAPARHLDE